MKKMYLAPNIRFLMRKLSHAIESIVIIFCVVGELVGMFLYLISPAHADAVWLNDWVFPRDFSAGIYPTLSWAFMVMLSLACMTFVACYETDRLLFINIEEEKDKEKI